MARGISSTIKDQLNKSELGGVFYLVDIALASGTRRIAEREITYNSNTYSPGLISISGLRSSQEGASDISIEISNVELDWTALEQDESFFGVSVTVYEYVRSPDETTVADAYVKWKGFADEPSEITQEHIVIPAFSGNPTTRTESPRRPIESQCTHTFANLTTTTTEITTALKSVTNFEGYGCTYRQSASIGFAGTLNADITAAATSFVVDLPSTAVSNGMIYAKLDEIKIDSEVMLVTAVTAIVSNQQTLTVTRAHRATTAAAHTASTTVLFNNCHFSKAACLARGMYGNNTSDQYSSTNRNYFGGFPIISGDLTSVPTGLHPLITKLRYGKKVTLAGNDSAYGITIPLVYGRCLVSSPTLLFVSDQGDFLTTGWVVSEGVLATNASNDTQSSNGLDAYYPSPNAGTENIFVNGARRHDTRANFGIETFNGQQDKSPPSTSGFFGTTSVPDFDTYKFAAWGTAWVIIKTKKENNVRVDLTSGISAQMEVAFGRLVRVYSDATTFVRKATTNPAWVLMDYEASKHSGGGVDYSKFDAAAFKTVADYNDTNVSSVIDGTSVKRWTFNGAIVDKKPFTDYERLICLAMYCTPPYVNASGKITIKNLKSETLSGLPFFSSKSTTLSERNIIWENGHSSLVKSRQSIQNVPNQIKVNFNELTSDNKWIPSQGVIEDRVVQRRLGTLAGDNSIRVISKTIDLLGVTTRDEAARIGTLILRAGEFARGGLENNLTITFKCFYKTAADVEIGDVIEVQDDLLDSTINEQYFRVVEINDDPQTISGGGFVMVRTITATLHKNSIYDDGAGSLTTVSRLDGPVPHDKEAPPVTSAGVAEAGTFDSNNKPITSLTFTYTEPSPKENFKDVVIMRSNLTNTAAAYDAVTNPAVDDWRLITTINKTNNVVQNYEVTNKYEVFTFLSRNLEGSIPAPTTKTADGTAFKYPRISVLIDGMTDGLTAPANFQIFIGSGTVSLKWDAYTGNNLKLFKAFHVYRNTVDDLGSATKIATLDGTLFVDTTVAASTTYYYWVRALSILNIEGDATSSVNTTSPSDAGTDSGVPTAPTLGTVQGYGAFNPNEYTWKVGIERPGGASNWNGVTDTDLVISTDNAITGADPLTASFPTGKSLNRSGSNAYQIKPPFTVDFTTNFPSTYYMRARVKNSFGYSAWSTALTRKTNMSDNLSSDTAIPNAPDALAINVTSGKSYLAGDQFEISFEIPTTNTASYWGYSVYINNSSTLPTATTQEIGIAGEITAGSAVLTDSTKAWSVNAYVGKDLVVFHPSRGGTAVTFTATAATDRITATAHGLAVNDELMATSTGTLPAGLSNTTRYFVNSVVDADNVTVSTTVGGGTVDITDTGSGTHSYKKVTFDYEGLMLLGKITSNTATTITFETPTDRLYRTHPNDTDSSKCTFYVVNNNAGHHFWEKLSFSTPAIVNEGVFALTEERASRKRSLVFSSNITQVHTWVAIYNLHGQGKVTGSPVNATFAGITSNGIGTSAITTVKINNLAITETKIDTDAVTTPKILANSVTAAKISVSQLSAINADLGTITAGTVTGATLRTAASGARIELDSTNGLRGFDSGGTAISQITIGGLLKANILDVISGNALQLQAGSNDYVLIRKTASPVMSVVVDSTQRGQFDSNGFQVPNGNIETSGSYRMDAADVINTSAAFVGSGGVNTSGNIETSSSYKMDGSDVINTAGAFVGGGGVAVGATASISGERYIIAGNGANALSFDAGTGLVIGDTATWTALRFYAGSASEQMKIDLNESSTQSAMLLRGDGSLRRVSIDNSDLGTGAKRYLYLA